MHETLKELAGELAVIHEALERAEVIERQLPAYLRELEAERDQLRAEVERLRVRGDDFRTEMVATALDHAAATARAEAAEARAEDLRGALEAGRADRWAATVGNTETDAFSPSPWVIAAEALIDRLEKESANALANS